MITVSSVLTLVWMFVVVAALTFQILAIRNLMKVNRNLMRRIEIMEEITFKHLGVPL